MLLIPAIDLKDGRCVRLRQGDLDDATRRTMTFLPLDATLGERLAAERLRRVETAETEPAGAITLLEFRELVRGLASGPDEIVGASG